MKKCAFFFMQVLFLMSCERIEENTQECLQKTISRKSEFSVSLNDANRFVEIYKSGKSYQVTPLVVESDTSLYIYNFKSGWLIVSGDRRLNPIVGESQTGNIDLENISDGLKVWIYTTASDIRNKKYDISIEDNQHTEMWSSISSHRNRNKVKSVSTKTAEMKWCIVTSLHSVEYTQEDIIPHLIKTKWGQGGPWNAKLPMDDSDGKKCWTGCVAVAVAQMLYYTHYFLGKPNKLYHSVSCSKQHISGSTTNIGFSRGDLDLDSPRWDMMAKYWYETNTSYVGDLMLDIGNRLGMEYSGEGSGTNLSTTGLANYDLTYTTGDYSYSVVQNNLKKGLPVIVTAGNKVGLSYSGGHAWIIDGVRRRYATYTYEKHIEYSENWMNESEYFESFDEIRWKYNVNDEFDIWYVETSGTTDYLLMNWGYDGSYDDDSYFVDGEWNANGSSHMYKRKIYYDFR